MLSEEMINQDAYHASGDLEAHGRVDVFQNLLDSDVERLHVLITRHAKLTGSKRAADILANWKTWLPKFRKVTPVEYRRAEGNEGERRRRAENRDRGVAEYSNRHCERERSNRQQGQKNWIASFASAQYCLAI